MTLVRTFPASPDELRVGPAAADLILSLIITIWGTKRCFAINQSGSGGDFIARMTCLTLPVSIRWTVVVIPYLFITAFFLEFIERVFEEGSSDKYYLCMRKWRSSKYCIWGIFCI